MPDISNTVYRIVVCAVFQHVRYDDEFEVLEVGLDGAGRLDGIGLSLLPDYSAYPITGFEGDSQDTESYEPGDAGDL